MQRVYNILVSLFGESKQGYYDKSVTQYQFNSPWAKEELGYADGKYNLEVSFSLGKWHEWTNNYGGNISSLIKEWGGSGFADEYSNIIKDLRESRYYNLNLYKDNADLWVEKSLKLPSTFTKIDLASCRNRALVEYLNKRRITQDIIDRYNIGYTKWDGEEYAWRNRIIFPSYNSFGDLNYFVGRTYKPNDKRGKYKNCDAEKSEIIFNEHLVQWDARIILVEGIVDSIYCHNTIPLMGKFLKEDSALYRKIKSDCHGEIIICLDADTEFYESARICKMLDRDNLLGKVRIIPLFEHCDGKKDFGEIYEAEGKKGIINAIRSARNLTFKETVININKKNKSHYGKTKSVSAY